VAAGFHTLHSTADLDIKSDSKFIESFATPESKKPR